MPIFIVALFIISKKGYWETTQASNRGIDQQHVVYTYESFGSHFHRGGVGWGSWGRFHTPTGNVLTLAGCPMVRQKDR